MPLSLMTNYGLYHGVQMISNTILLVYFGLLLFTIILPVVI